MLPYQIVMSLSWFVVCLFMCKSLTRTIKGRPVDGDEWKALICLMGGLMATFSARWVFWADNIWFWKILYLTSIGAALCAVLMLWNGRK